MLNELCNQMAQLESEHCAPCAHEDTSYCQQCPYNERIAALAVQIKNLRAGLTIS